MAAKSRLPLTAQQQKKSSPLDKYKGLRTKQFVSVAECEYFIKWATINAPMAEEIAEALESAKKELKVLKAKIKGDFTD